MIYHDAYFDAGIDRQGTCASKWSAPGVMQQGAIPLWVADMDFPCAEPIRDALIKRAGHACYGYTFEDQPARDAARAFWNRRHGVQFSEMDSIMMPSVVSGLSACVNTLTKEGDGVIVLTPVYPPFYGAVTGNGRQILDTPLIRDVQGRYHMDYEAIEAHLRGGSRLLLLCNPHNPVSRLWTEAELDRLFALISRYQAVVVSDEIHADFVYKPNTFASALLKPAWAAHAVCLIAGSKTFNIAGLKQSWMICTDGERREKLLTWVHRAGVDSGNLFAIEANKAAFTDCDAWLDGLLKYLDGNRKVLHDTLHELLPEAFVTPIEATYLAWLDVRAYCDDNKMLMKRCITAGVVPSDGIAFGQLSGRGFLRINFGCPRLQLAEGLKRLADAVSCK